MPPGSLFRGVTIDAAKRGGIGFQALQSRIKQPRGAAVGSALDVVIRRGNLDQTLKKLFDIRFRNEPDRFPRLVRFPEFAPVEVIDSRARVGDEIGLQSPARMPFLNRSHMEAVKSAVVPVPPMSRVRCSGPEARTLAIASWIRVAADVSPI